MTEKKSSDRPRRMAIPRSRRLVMYVLHQHQKVPTTAHDRICDLSVVAAARAQTVVRISWPLLFVKAYALVALRYPPLRQFLMRWPWPHLYQHPSSVSTVVTHRDVDGEPWVFWSRFLEPEAQPLTALQAKMDHYQTGPVQSVFKKQWFVSGLPTPIRQLLMWCILNFSGRTRARTTSTFVLTTIGSQGAEIQHPPGFLTGNLTFGPIDGHGRCRVTLAYDHRLLDGHMVADILADLEQTLNEVIAAELRTLAAIPLRRAV